MSETQYPKGWNEKPVQGVLDHYERQIADVGAMGSGRSGLGFFQRVHPNIEGNSKLRDPQVEGFQKISDHFGGPDASRAVAVVLPVGCGKTGLITLVPFAADARRVLVIAPGLEISEQLERAFHPSEPKHYFYGKFAVVDSGDQPEPATIRNQGTIFEDLEDADVVVTNVHQLQGTENRWLAELPPDFFDLVLFDEGHHNVAESWRAIRKAFPEARVVSFSATPTRADGQLMEGKIVYSYSVFRAIERGYVKRLKAQVLNPRLLRYVRREGAEEIEVGLEEVRRLGEVDADFRRSIVSSAKSLQTIVDASIRELLRIREATGEGRHKIIASALNQEHCRQIVQAYKERKLRADYVHSNVSAVANKRILDKLRNNQLDVIVQVRKLGEGFDHPYLSVAAVLSIFANLSPFVQFVGRIMRAVDQGNPDSSNNVGTVVYHAGANVARVWSDFQAFSQADQDYFDQLLTTEDVFVGEDDELLLEPQPRDPVARESFEISHQGAVTLEEIPLIEQDGEALERLRWLRERGYTEDDIRKGMELIDIPVTKQVARQAAISTLDPRVKTAATKMLARHGREAFQKGLDPRWPERDNFVVVKSAIDTKLKKLAGGRSRKKYRRDDIEAIETRFDEIVAEVERELFDV